MGYRRVKYGCTRLDLADLYMVDKNTMTSLVRKCGITHSGKLMPIEIEMIKNKLGDPARDGI